MTYVLKKERKVTTLNRRRQGMVLIPLVPRPLGRLPLLMMVSAGAQAVKTPTGVQTPTGVRTPTDTPSPAGCEDAIDTEEDAALALRFGFHI
jgi:hypothetical protein